MTAADYQAAIHREHVRLGIRSQNCAHCATPPLSPWVRRALAGTLPTKEYAR